MVVDDFDIGWSFLSPFEADSVLIVDAYAVLSFTRTLERFEAVPSDDADIFKRTRRIQSPEPRASLIFNAGQFFDPLIARQPSCTLIPEGLDHP